jgi:hypothetical protein
MFFEIQLKSVELKAHITEKQSPFFASGSIVVNYLRLETG